MTLSASRRRHAHGRVRLQGHPRREGRPQGRRRRSSRSTAGTKTKLDDRRRRGAQSAGQEGTKVTLTIRRKGAEGRSTFTITRAKIAIPNIMTEMVGKDVGYIRLMQFNAQRRRRTSTQGDRASSTSKGAKGYVLDLRENPGGLLVAGRRASRRCSSRAASIVRVDERGKPEEQSRWPRATRPPTSRSWCSSTATPPPPAEIVAGALQDYKRATLVGVKSFGKGSVQTVRELYNGGAVKLTIAHYLTPKSRVIDGKGVTPDVVVPMDLALQAKQKTDTQLKKALDVLRCKFEAGSYRLSPAETKKARRVMRGPFCSRSSGLASAAVLVLVVVERRRTTPRRTRRRPRAGASGLRLLRAVRLVDGRERERHAVADERRRRTRRRRPWRT